MTQPAKARQITIEPIIKYPRLAQVEQTYLLTIDLRPVLDPGGWPYDEEEYAIHCLLDTLPLFSHEPVGEPVVVVHRFGGSYGPASFLLTAAAEEMTGRIQVTLVNEWGLPIDVLDLESIWISHHSELQSVRNWYVDSKPDPIRQIYLQYIINRYRYLDFRGLGVSDRIPLRLPLVEMYVPLKARIELPEGETWSRRQGFAAPQLRLAGRKVSSEEVEATGQRLSESLPVLELLQQYPGLVILGDPGAGKTTFLKYLALRLASGEGKILGLGSRLPILLPLSAYANALAEKDTPLDRFIPIYYQNRGIDPQLGPMLDEALTQGKVLLLLDGLDEINHRNRRGLVVERVLDFFNQYQQQGNRFILTSRIVGYREVRPTSAGLVECTLVDFDDEEIEAFITQWTGALERAATGDTQVAMQDAARERAELLAAVDRNVGVRQLAANPLLLTILALMKQQGIILPEQRVELYQKYVETLLKTWNLARSLDRPAVRDLDVVETLKVLAPLALWIHQTSPGVGLVKQAELRRELERIYRDRAITDPKATTQQFLADVREYAALMMERGPGEYGFIHLAFQEYLAAVALSQLGQRNVEPVVEALATHLDDDNWREVSLLTVGYIGIIQQRDQAAGDLVLKLTQRSPAGAILAGEAVCDAGPGGVTAHARAKVVEALVKMLQAERQVKPVTHAAAGRVLGRLGDPRPGVTTLPPLLTRVIEGEFLYGERNERRTVAYFQAGVYPVTNAQFAQFIAAAGYDSAIWWGNEGWQWRQQEGWTQPRYWQNPEYNDPNQPVVGVSWYEAEAFCKWLTATNNEKRTYRLPTEAEWERLARGQYGRLYPWGNEWQDGLCNTEESGINQPSTVGIFPNSISPTGAHDCAGNVWEWCLDYYDNTHSLQTLRGGSFSSWSQEAQCTVRQASNPTEVRNDGGFRVVMLEMPIVRTQISLRELEQIVEDILYDLAAELINSDEEVVAKMAQTNALGFGLDSYEIVSIDFDEDNQKIHFEANLDISGDSDEDKPYCGDMVMVHILGTLKFVQNRWELETYEVQSCKLNWP